MSLLEQPQALSRIMTRMGCPFCYLKYRLHTAFDLPLSALVYPLGLEPLPHARVTLALTCLALLVAPSGSSSG
jgi:hypothetical protein